MKLRQWLFLAMAVGVAAACIRLGFWQLDRLQQRRAQNEAIRQGLAQAPIDLNQVSNPAELDAYQRVQVEGTYDADQEIVLSPRALNGQPGVHLVTPLRLANQPTAILVDRGWIPANERNLPARARYNTAGPVTVSGYLRPGSQETSLFFLPEADDQESKQEWQVLDLEAIQQQIDAPLIPWVLVQMEPLEVEDPQPIPQPDLDLSEGPHLGYALQWFSFAAIALFGGGYWLWRQQDSA